MYVNKNVCLISRLLTRGVSIRAMSHADEQGGWTLLTAHGRALVAIAQDPDARMRDLAEVVGVTERTVQAIVANLEEAGYVTHTRVGRRNRYTVHLDRPFRHPAQDGHQIGPFLDLLGPPAPGN
jgi:DNA-binding MarR family transcriptional regulator